MPRRTAWVAAALLLAAIAAVALSGEHDRSAGEIRGRQRSAASVAESRARVAQSASWLAPGGDAPARQVLFGDLHVHSTFSVDAFLYALPLFGGEGAHPPADACDFARHCATLDFFSINDHAEGLTPARWRETIESIRQCNALAGDSEHPDLVAFVGWEWTQTGDTPERHHGHRNVIFPGLADDELPTRPITALPDGTTDRARAMWLVRGLEELGPLGLGDAADFLWQIRQITEIPDCERGVDPRQLPVDCRENASTPAELEARLSRWGLDHLVIPHGLAWGVHAPPGADLANDLADGNHPNGERLVEIFSGHGNGEEYREAAERRIGADGAPQCPEPTADFLPCCWRAGEIVRARCGDLPAEECEARVREARQLALAAGTSPHRVFPDARPEDWLDCDQCRDCFKPVANPRPRQTAQYSLAVSSFDDADPAAPPRRYRWGFIGSSDNHTGRPGTGYKQYARTMMTDARGLASPLVERIVRPYAVGRQQDPRRAQPSRAEGLGFVNLLDVERGASFMFPGGLVAVHADGGDRRAIWNALMRREVYGTSGPRILLWFDLVNGPDGTTPMGSAVVQTDTPLFQVRAAGAFVQLPGCPPDAHSGLSPERLERLCRGECYHPGDERHPIEAIEIVRVRPQIRPDEAPASLIDDPWRRFVCDGEPGGCVVQFEDPEYAASGRPAVYYVRAIQTPTPAINAANLRTEFDSAGNAVRTAPCHGGYRTPADDDCLSPIRERAWSSPIFVRPVASAAN
ncbi:MAG: DUF3604 domain-containing protein [Myxococcota bacterium]